MNDETMNDEMQRTLDECRRNGEPIESERPLSVYLCPACKIVWIPATTYQKTNDDMRDAMERMLAGKAQERLHASCGGGN